MKNYKRFFNNTIFSVFLLLFSSLFVVLFCLLVVSYEQLTKHGKFVEGISSEVLPGIVETSNLASKISELELLLSKMVEVKNDVQLRVAYKKVLESMEFIETSSLSSSNKRFLVSITMEIENILDLFKKESFCKEQIKSKTLEFEQLKDKTIEELKQNQAFLEYWNFFDEMSILSYESYYAQISDLIKTEKKAFSALKKISNKNENILKIENLLFSNDGLFAFWKKYLRINNEIQQTWAFLQSLIKGFSEEVQFSSVKSNQELTGKVERIATAFKLKTKILFLIFVFCLIYFIAIVYYFRIRIVKRLFKLNDFIDEKISVSDSNLEDQYNDEISHVVESFNFFNKRVLEQNKQLEKLTLIDSLTGIPNKRSFVEEFNQEFLRIKRTGSSSSCFMIDVDDFKLYNDNYGHMAGDKCLKKVASAIKEVVSLKSGFVARYGGEEFVCVLPDTEVDMSKKIAKSLVLAVAKLKIPHSFAKSHSCVTVSVGIKTFCAKDLLLEEIIEKADKALYFAKENGKNTFAHYDELD